MIAPPAATLRTRARTAPSLRCEVLRALLYYDLWNYPLTATELRAFAPAPPQSGDDFAGALARLEREGVIAREGIYYALPGKSRAAADARRRGERRARWMWMAARAAAMVMKRFPFVRAVMVSGELSKHAARPGSDVDFLILTEPGRLWIARTMLALFKKTALLNRKKFFCINSFACTDAMAVEERNVYQAAEIAQLKPLYNTALHRAYLEANGWIREYFPNFAPELLASPRTSERRSALQRIAELPFRLLPADRLDAMLMRTMERHWERRYPDMEPGERRALFRCTRGESRAYAGNYQGRVLASYRRSLRDHGLEEE